jgi:hypothetical protein
MMFADPVSSTGNSGVSTGGEVANALVCKTSIRGFNSRPVLQRSLVKILVTVAVFAVFPVLIAQHTPGPPPKSSEAKFH